MEDRIDLRIAPAIDTLRALPADRTIDLAFVDADKPMYGAYADEILARMRPGGVLLVDNVLWGGAVVDAVSTDENTVAIRAFNDWLAADERVETVMLPLGDGLTLARRVRRRTRSQNSCWSADRTSPIAQLRRSELVQSNVPVRP